MPVLSSETLLISDPAAKPDNPFQLTDADKLRMRLIKPALESQGLGDAHENQGGAMVYRQTAISRGVRLQSKSYHDTSDNKVRPTKTRLGGLCNAVPEDALSLLTGHSVNNSALTPLYIAKDGALEVLMLLARFGPGLDHRGFSCNKHYIQGRHLLTSSDIQSAHPEIWALISAQLLPGLDELLSGLRAKAVRSKDETRQLRCAEFCFNLREAFLQDSAWHFFDPLYTPVFAGLSLYRIEAFVRWLTESFRPELVSLQTEADAVSKYICGSSSLLDRSLDALCIDRASTASESRRLLHEMHKRMLRDKACMSRADSAADQQLQQQ
ncbi:TPA: hypothetical protein ACH3X1_003382 [Trebouxia sp. C0004]